MSKRWVIKLGSGLLTRPDGKVDRVQIGRIADQVAGLMRRGIEVVLVSSGAVAAGMTAMGLEKRPKDAPYPAGLRKAAEAKAADAPAADAEPKA